MYVERESRDALYHGENCNQFTRQAVFATYCCRCWSGFALGFNLRWTYGSTKRRERP